MTRKQRVRAALAGREVDHPPASLWGHDYLREWNPRDLADATLEQYRAFGWDFVKLNPRATYFAEAWGNAYRPSGVQQRPDLLSVAVANAGALDLLAPLDPAAGVFAEHLEALRLVIAGTGGEVDVLHTIFSPLAVVGLLCGPGSEFSALAKANPAGAHAALAAVAQTLAAYAGLALAAGAAGIFYAPLAWASHDTCDEAFYREFGRPYDLQILAAIRHADFNVLHVCRDRNMLRLLLDYPVAAFNWADRGEGNSGIEEVRASTTAAVMGGVDHVRLPVMSPPEVAAQVRDALAGGTAKLLVSGGCSVPPGTPAANRAAVAAAARA